MKTIIKIFSFLIGIAILVANPSMFMFISFALLPAIAAYFIDRLPGRSTSTTILYFNLAGVGIFVMQILQGKMSIHNVGDAINLHWFLVVYLFAGFGWFLVWILPKIAISLSEYRIQRRINLMEDKLKELCEEWGESVKG